jgi:outer membrane protein assembly factor BamB
MEHRWVAWLKLVVAVFFSVLVFSFVILTVKGARQVEATPAEPSAGLEPYSVSTPLNSLPELVKELARLEVLPLRPSWEFKAGSGQVRLFPDRDRIYVASSTDSSGGFLYCVDAHSGRVLWSRAFDAWISCSPSAWEGIVYVGTTSDVLYALDATSGSTLWSFTAQGEILTPPVVDGGLLLFFADNGAVFGLSNRLYALDSGSGALLWSYDTASWTPSPPTTGHGMVFTAGSKSTVLALDRGTGKEVWASPVDSIVFSSPLLDGDRIYVATVNGRLYALEALTGARLWEVGMLHFTPSLPRLAGNNILLDRCPDGILAFSLQDGHAQWAMGGDALLVTEPFFSGIVYAYFPEGRLLELDAKTGRCRRIYVSDFDFSTRPWVSDGWLYFASSDGIVRATPLPGIPQEH